jgi:hypothetical protein
VGRLWCGKTYTPHWQQRKPWQVRGFCGIDKGLTMSASHTTSPIRIHLLLVLAQIFYSQYQTTKRMMTSMNWTPTHFPAPMRSLNPSTRAKAIEIANALMAQNGMDRQRAIELSIIEARRQAKVGRPELGRPELGRPELGRMEASLSIPN